MRKTKHKPSYTTSWKWWLVIVALLIGLGTLLYNRLITSPQIAELTPASSTSPIKGTFIAFPYSKLVQYTQADWVKQFDVMQKIGIDTLIIAGVFVKDYTNPLITAFYRTDLFKQYQSSLPHLDYIMDLADARGFKVYLSPVDMREYWGSPARRAENVSLSKQVSAELQAKGYTARPSFVGWYLQDEPFLNHNYPSYEHWSSLSTHFKSLTPDKKIIIAPFFIAPCKPNPTRMRCENQWWQDRSPSEIAALAKKLMQNSGADIMAVQDGVGASGVTLQELDQYLPPMAEAVRSIGKEFWVDAEVFRYNTDRTQFIPANIADLTAQLDHVKKYPTVIWIFEQFMGPYNNAPTNDLYRNYLSYYQLGSIDIPVYPKSIFDDVAVDDFAYPYIKALYDNKITSGCNASPLRYCPNRIVTRAEAAILIERARTMSLATPALPSKPRFNDVPLNFWAAPWIEQLAANGITSGCGINLYCPNAPLTRAQAAVMMMRARKGSSYIPTNRAVFSDVPANHWAAPWIAELSEQGITGGCGDGKFCPDSGITRAHLAIFLVRTFAIPIQ